MYIDVVIKHWSDTHSRLSSIMNQNVFFSKFSSLCNFINNIFSAHPWICTNEKVTLELLYYNFECGVNIRFLNFRQTP